MDVLPGDPTNENGQTYGMLPDPERQPDYVSTSLVEAVA
jgi:hypothetical protein